jgi:hypothetical protein
MFINKLLRGSSNTVAVYFKDNNNLPLVLSSPPTFSFNDFEGSLLVSGLCIQDNLDSSKWTATFTVPSQATITTSETTAYSLNFTAALPNNTTKQISRLYEVAESNFLVVNNNIPLVTTSDSLFTDLLQITYPFQVSQYTVALRTDLNYIFQTFPTITNPSVYASNQKYNIYRFDSNQILSAITNTSNVGGNLQVVWSYVVSGITYTKINPIYIVNALGFSMMQDLRMILDKYQFVDLDPNLQWRDYELLHFVIKGVQRINSTNPPTMFDLSNVPVSMTYAVGQAALVEACKSWFLAEAERAFDFQGQDISLNIDRTNYIQTIMDNANSWLESNLPSLKQSIAVQAAYGSRAIATISLSPTSNFPGLQTRYWPASRLL